MGHVRDRWMRRNPDTGRKVRAERWGKGKRYQARALRADGSTATAAFDLLADAERWLAKASLDPLVVAPRVGFAAAADDWLAHQLHFRDSTAEATKRRVETMLKPAFEGLALRDLTRARVQAAVADWSTRYAPSTVQVAYSHLTSILKAAHLDGLVDGPPVGIRLPRKPRTQVVPLAEAKVAALRASMPESLRSLVVVAAASGLRPSELAGLSWSRIDGQVLRVDRQLVRVESGRPVFGPPKSAAGDRRVPVGESATKALLEQRKQFGEGVDGLVWRPVRGGVLTRQMMADMWVARRAVVGSKPGEGWHQLRHYHASLLIAAGMSPVAVAARLGHASVTETMETYAHLWPTDDERMEAIAEGSTRALLGWEAPTGPAVVSGSSAD